ncbi:MAG: hypothetical protein WB992_25155 [Bryobacteraceae bacterium]
MSLERNPGKKYGLRWGFRKQDYVADFCLTARRTLRTSPDLLKLFELRFVYGKDSAQCRQNLHLSSSQLFERISQIEEQLGRVFRELRPHPLFPTDEYFSFKPGRSESKVVDIRSGRAPQNTNPVDIPDELLAA